MKNLLPEASPISSQRYLMTNHSTRNWIEASVRHVPPSLGCVREFGITRKWLSKRRSQFTPLLSSAPFCMEINPGLSNEKRLNTLHMKFLKQLLGNKWDARVTNYEVAHHAGIGSLYSILRLRRLGHVYRMSDGRIPKDLLYGDLALSKHSQGHPR